MDVDRRNHNALALQIIEMAEGDRLKYVSNSMSAKTLSKTMNELNALILSGSAAEREIARKAVASLGFVAN